MLNGEMHGFRAPTEMTPDELGDTLARLVWESFSDFLAEREAEAIFRELGIPTEEGIPPVNISEEVLIFVLWAHTRALQLAFYRRAPEELLRAALDAFHRAVFEDLAEQGTPAQQLPVLEQRVSARYAEYYHASEISDEWVGRTAAAVLARKDPGAVESVSPALYRTLTNQAIAVANPLRDFLEDVRLVSG